MEDLTRRSVLASAAAALWAWPRTDRGPLPSAGARFLLPASQPPADDRPFFASGFIDHDPPLAYVHCPSICELPAGGLACVWYAGSREAVRDVSLYLAESPSREPASSASAWGIPRLVIDRDRAVADLDRFVDKVGNAVLFPDASGRLWLVYVTIGVGGWSGSSLNACFSTDGGKTFSRSQRLSLSPFFNVSELVRAAPVLLDSGEIALPVYHECIGKFPEVVWLRPEGDRLVARKSRMAGGRSLLQPAIVPIGGTEAVAFLRDHGPARRLVEQRTRDGGRSWSAPQPTPLANPDASVAAVRLSNGAVFVALNHSAANRENLSLAIHDPSSEEWRIIATLDRESGQKFAYPYMIQDRRGLVHLVYTWKMKRIRHVAMNETWIFAQPSEPIR
ncbi:MAG: exo-alpha-sialidase [Planctomycetia bacterium]|jgi:predicted neuraminidase